MVWINTDKEWEKLGRDDPYFGVVTHEKYHQSNLTEERKEEFFQSGSRHITEVLETIRKHVDPDFRINSAIDFGCGVGRLAIPLAKFADSVTAVDVSDSMLEEAKRNCKSRSIGNVKLVKADDGLTSLEGRFNFIHSFIVFQHIPVRRGELILRNLLAHLEEGGVCVAHFTYNSGKRMRRLVSFMKSWIPLSANVANLMKGRPFLAPQIQMYEYDLNRLFSVMQNAGAINCHAEFTDHSGDLGVMLYCKKARKNSNPCHQTS